MLGAWEHDYYDEAVDYLRALLSAGLKDNPFLFKGVMTGVLRVARESMFAGLNNVEVYSLLRARGGEHFGFTEAEVLGLLADYGRADEAGEVRDWYNGYRFGNVTVYNPISITSMLAYPESPLLPYWVNTSENGLVRALLLETAHLRTNIEILLEGGFFESRVEEDVSLRQLSGESVWSLFLFSGYLKAESVRIEDGVQYAKLRIPNTEVRSLWRGTFSRWLLDYSGGLGPLHHAVLTGDAPVLQILLSAMLLRHVSSFDLTNRQVRTEDGLSAFHRGNTTQAEAFYHAFVLGLLVTLETTHRVRSNRESGRGRPDLLILPRHAGQPGVVLEFKRRPPAPGLPDDVADALATLAEAALAQIRDEKYTTELEEAGAAPIVRLGIAFGGREVVVRAG